MTNTEDVNAADVSCIDLLEWLRGKLTDAEKTLAAREQAATTWKGGTNASWAAAARMHPSTASEPPLTKAARVEIATREERIATRCRYDVLMFRSAISALSHSNDQDQRPAPARKD